MRSGLVLTLALGCVAFTHATAQAQPKGGGAGWLPTLDQGKAQAKMSGKPLMLVFRCVP